MHFDDYMKFTDETAIYPQHYEDIESVDPVTLAQWIGLAYVIGKLNGEAGELAELHFKALRDEACIITDDRAELMRGELGDLLYYCARVAQHLGYSLDDIAAENMEKLRSRKERGVLQGSGSDR